MEDFIISIQNHLYSVTNLFKNSCKNLDDRQVSLWSDQLAQEACKLLAERVRHLTAEDHDHDGCLCHHHCHHDQ